MCFPSLLSLLLCLQCWNVSCSTSILTFFSSIYTNVLKRKICCVWGRWKMEHLLSRNVIEIVSDWQKKNQALSYLSSYFIAFRPFHSKSTNKSIFQVGSSVVMISYCWLWKHINHRLNVSLSDRVQGPDQRLYYSVLRNTYRCYMSQNGMCYPL